MSSSRDLLVRVRYIQSLPAPPFPPKLLTVPTSLARFAAFETTKALNDERDLPMNAGSDLGMPVDLAASFPGVDYWEQKLPERQERFMPQEDTSPFLESEDEELCRELPAGGAALGAALAGKTTQASGIMTSASNTPASAQVSWLRRTEYGSSTFDTKISSPATTPRKKGNHKILSRSERIQAIKASFDSANSPLADARDPTNMHKIPETEHALLPDADIWNTTYNFVRYPDNPSVPDPQTKVLEDVQNGPGARTDTAILRLVSIPDEEARMAYYLPADEEQAQGYKQRKSERTPLDWNDVSDQLPDGPEHTFTYTFVRDYEPIVRPLRSEFLLMMDDANEDATASQDSRHRQRGAYYIPVTEMHQLKKRRRARGEDPLVYGQAAMELGIEAWDRLAVNLGRNPQDIPPEFCGPFSYEEKLMCFRKI